MIHTHLSPARYFILAFLSLCLGGCPAEDVTPADAGTDGRVIEVDGAVEANLCDCCGTFVSVTNGESCVGGVCDPWCGTIDPCGASCDRATSVCLIRYGGVDAGPPHDGGAAPEPRHECIPRPTACEDIGNCGGPRPERSCDASDPCFDALDCVPQQVVHVDYLISCRGA